MTTTFDRLYQHALDRKLYMGHDTPRERTRTPQINAHSNLLAKRRPDDAPVWDQLYKSGYNRSTRSPEPSVSPRVQSTASAAQLTAQRGAHSIIARSEQYASTIERREAQHQARINDDERCTFSPDRFSRRSSRSQVRSAGRERERLQDRAKGLMDRRNERIEDAQREKEMDAERCTFRPRVSRRSPHTATSPHLREEDPSPPVDPTQPPTRVRQTPRAPTRPTPANPTLPANFAETLAEFSAMVNSIPLKPAIHRARPDLDAIEAEERRLEAELGLMPAM